MTLNSIENPSNDNIKHESYIIPEPLNSIPIKRLFDYKHLKLRESTKLPREFEFEQSNDEEIILKVKMIGINYQKDFEAFKDRKFSPHNNLVPGNKIIGKIYATQEHGFPPSIYNSKYLLFPYSNCIHQCISDKCHNCQYLIDNHTTHLTHDNYNDYKDHPCTKDLIYGYTIDGGLQDYIKIKHSNDILLKIPDNISLHDCCFLFDIMLPFYSFVKDNFLNNDNESPRININGKVLIILNDRSKEVNDILIIVKHFGVDQKSIVFLDKKKIDNLTDNERASYKLKFSQIFLFNASDEAVQFALYSSISTGLESTRFRYNIILFDQHSPMSIQKNKHLGRYHHDKTIHHFKLSYKDKINAAEILQIISNLNDSVKSSYKEEFEKDVEARPSVTSSETSESILSSSSIHSESTTSTSVSAPREKGRINLSKALRFRNGESIIGENIKKQINYYSWLWYDKDFDLCSNHEISDNEDNDDYQSGSERAKVHSTKQVNKLIKNPRNLSRVCYNNRSNKSVKVNAFIFS